MCWARGWVQAGHPAVICYDLPELPFLEGPFDDVAFVFSLGDWQASAIHLDRLRLPSLLWRPLAVAVFALLCGSGVLAHPPFGPRALPSLLRYQRSVDLSMDHAQQAVS